MPNSTTTRRKFLSTTTRAAVALPVVSGPLILNADDKSGSKDPIVGSGEHTYRVIHNWGRNSLPSTHDYGNASHGVSVDRQGHVYITHTARLTQFTCLTLMADSSKALLDSIASPRATPLRPVAMASTFELKVTKSSFTYQLPMRKIFCQNVARR